MKKAILIFTALLCFLCLDVFAFHFWRGASDQIVAEKLPSKENKENSDWFNITVGAAFGLIGVAFGAHLSNRKSKQECAFNLHAEFNSSEMSVIRHSAFDVVQRTIDIDLEKLSSIDNANNAHGIYVVLRFYQKLWFAVYHKRIDHKLALDLFDDLFYFWYYVYFKDNLTDVLNWKAGKDLKLLSEWFEKKLSRERHEFLKADKIRERKLVLEKFDNFTPKPKSKISRILDLLLE